MSYFYTDESRETDPHALPDAEVFYQEPGAVDDGTDNESPAGFYWWLCFPGCHPSSDPCGPFDTEADAIEDARAYRLDIV